jgi:hypothetical protein
MVNNMFDTHAIRFNNRETFNLAVAILRKSDFCDFFHDIGHSDMIITFSDKIVFDGFVSELGVHQIWDKPSFKGPADFTIQIQ